MAFPLGAVLAAAPGIISAASDLLRMIKNKKQDAPLPDSDKLVQLEKLAEQQVQLIEELAVNNRNLVLAVRNNRIISLAALLVAGIALIIAF